MQRAVFFALICFFLFVSGCASADDSVQLEFTSGEIFELNYPIVLVHGIAKIDRKDNVESWGRIPKVLREHGIQVYFGNTDAWGSIESNAELLKKTIDSILEKTRHKKVNIIAHSKGGIDSRYFIWRYDYGDRVASLTTLSTPHGGAEVADILYDTRIVHFKPLRSRFQEIARVFGDKNPDIRGLSNNLTTENMKEFNETITRDVRVHYRSIYSVMDHPLDDPMYYISYALIKNINGENDGLVSARSASWGDNPIKLPVSLSHRQIIDNEEDNFHGVHVPSIYLDIVRELTWRGF